MSDLGSLSTAELIKGVDLAGQLIRMGCMDLVNMDTFSDYRQEITRRNDEARKRIEELKRRYDQ